MGDNNIPKWKARLPDILSYSRIVMIFPLLVIAYFKLRVVFLIVYALTMLTDTIDGFLARRWKVESEKGAAADAVPDVILGIASIPMLYLLLPEVFMHYVWSITGIATYVVLVRTVTSLKSNHATGMHIWSEKATMALLAVAVLVTVYLGKANFTIPLFIAVAAVSFTEEFLIQMLHTNVHPDTISIFRIRYK